MRTTDKLGFKLIIREPNVAERTVVVCPRYEGLKIKWSRPNGKMYYQKELSGTIKFWGVDFNVVNKCALRTKFTLVVYELKRGEIARADFSKTDCKWDINHAECDVDVSVWNPYKKIEAAKDNEYNLVKLGLLKHTLNFYVYPQNQIYFQEDNIITLYSKQDFPTQPTVAPTHNHSDLQRMWFGYTVISGAVKLDVGEDEYTFVAQFNDFSTTIQVGSVQYKCVHIGDKVISGETYGLYFGYAKGTSTEVYQFYDSLPFSVIWYKSQAPIFFGNTPSVRYDSLYSLTGYHPGGSGAFDFSCRIWVSYTGLATMQELSGLEMPSDDITSGFNHNMKSRTPTTLAPSFVKNHIGVSTRTSETDKGYGRVENTQLFYDTPDDNHNWMPVRKDSWFGGISLWVEGFVVSHYYSNSYRAISFVNDFYSLTDSIRAVVQQIDEDIHFDTQDSHFLFDNMNPVGGAQQGTLYISQKSNVLKLGYDYPAWQAPITWGKIETLLNNAFNCYWEIYEQNGERHLRIEHRTYFENGGTYDGSSLAETIDLRTIYRTSNRTPFSDKTNRWEWDKEGGSTSSRANRYEYGWMDTQSAIFDGETIEVPEEYRLFEDERVEERKVDWFSSDIDFLVSVQAECSSDGFALVMESLANAGWIITDNPNYDGQNYELSLEYLQPRYLLAGIYSTMVKIGDNTYPNTFTSRLRKADLEFSLPEGKTIEAGDIIWTEVGKGWSEALELDLSSMKWTATVRYNNE